MSLTIKIMFDDGTLIDDGVGLQLLSNAQAVATALTASGMVTFDVDPSTLTNPAVNLSQDQTPPPGFEGPE